ncbi:MAG: hypothetical protein HKO53_07255 [Gemmatimonadetes bacterium]|nr:hypothetical protein [Gemmatimonadota bacterium]
MSDRDFDNGRVVLGSIVFDPGSGELVGPGGRVRLAPQPSRLLAFLSSRGGQVVSRADIADHLWPHGAVEADQGIGFAVREVRKGMEAAGGDPSLVETIPRRGLRVVAEAAPADEPAVVVGGKGARSRSRVLIGVALASILGWSLLRSEPPPVLAIFQHETPGDEASRALAAQLSDALTTVAFQDLGGTVGVVGPTGTASVEGPDETARLREEIGACLVLSGGLRVASDTGVVVFTQLVRTSDRVHVWASLDTLAVEDALTEAVPDIVAGVESVLDVCD